MMRPLAATPKVANRHWMRRILKAAIWMHLSVLMLGMTVHPANAQYPTRPIKVMVSALPGAVTDVMARLIAEQLSSQLGQPVVVENRSGASSLLAADLLAKSPPDGYTLMISPNGLLIAPHILPKGSAGGVDVTRDIVPVITLGSMPIVPLINPGLNIKTVSELISRARKSPELTYASGGTGSALHLAAELFQRAAGVKLVHIPYKGLAQATTDVVSGTVDMMFGTAGGVMAEMVAAGKLIPLAVAENKRSPLMPTVPTMYEAGVKGAELDAWFMLFAPNGTPRDILLRLNSETAKVLALPEIRQRLLAMGVAPGGGTLESSAKTVNQDFVRYGDIVRDANVVAK